MVIKITSTFGAILWNSFGSASRLAWLYVIKHHPEVD